MKKILSILLLTVSSISASFAQHNYFQDLIDDLQQGRCFEAMDLRMRHANELPQNDSTLNLVYKLHMALYFNKPDSAAIYLEDLFANHKLKIGPAIGTYSGKLLQVYDYAQQFDKGIDFCDKLIDYFNRNPFDLEHDFVQNELNIVEGMKSSFKKRDINEPRIKVERDRTSNDSTIKLNEKQRIHFKAKYNDTEVETLFDTGVTYHFCLSKKLADEIGVIVVDKTQDSIKMVNKKPIKATMGVIKNINLGNVTLYNIPVLVFNETVAPNLPDTLNPEAKAKMVEVFSDKQITMGLQAMKLIGKFEVDWAMRTISFPDNTERIKTNASSNIFFIDNDPYIRLKINGLPFVGHFDTGADDFVVLSSSFYEKNKNSIEIDSVTQKKPMNIITMGQVAENVPHEIVKDAKVYLTGKHLNKDGTAVLISARTPFLNTFDGTVGIECLRRIGSKVILDFDNMKIEGKD